MNIDEWSARAKCKLFNEYGYKTYALMLCEMIPLFLQHNLGHIYYLSWKIQLLMMT